MFDWLTADAIDDLARGSVLTIVLAAVTSALSMGAGIGLGALRLSSRRRLRLPATAAVEVFRNIPALIQIIFWAFAVPTLFEPELRRTLFFDNRLMDALGDATGIPIPYYALAGGFALVLNTSAYLAELVRAGVASVPREHVDTARSLGAGRATAFLTVALPGGLRTSFPAITTRLIHNVKNTSLVSFVAVPELFHALQASINRSFRAAEFLLLGAVLYLLLTAASTALLDRIDLRLHRNRPAVDARSLGG